MPDLTRTSEGGAAMHEENTAVVQDRRLGACSACGYTPVAFDARVCPRCGLKNPNPGVANRFAGRGMLLGLAGGVLVGGVAGFFSFGPGGPWGAFGGALLGGIPGFVVGLVIGLVLAVVNRLAGRR